MKNNVLFKAAVLAVALAAFPFSASAQQEQQTKKGPYVTNGFWDNWFISAGAGIQTPFDRTDNNGGSDITPAFDFSLGKWITPVWGTRFQVGGFQVKSGEHYYVPSSDYVGYRPKMNYVHYHADALFNLSAALGGYKETRVYEMIPFVGFGGITSTNQSTNEIAFDAGLLNRFRISKHFDINLELRGMLYNAFDTENEAFRNKTKGIGSVTVGLTYRFGFKPFRRASELQTDLTPYNRRINNLEDDLAASKARQAALEKALAEAAQKPAVVEVVESDVNAGTAVFFTIGKTDINAEGKIVLDQMVQTIKSSEDKFVVTGYADKETGTKARNMQLSQQRAQNVHDYLVSKGVNPDRLDVIAKGSEVNPFSQAYLNRVVIVKR